MEGVDESVARLLEMRRDVYRLFAQLYFKELDEGQVRVLAGVDGRESPLDALGDLDGPVGEGARIARRYLRRVTSATREELAVDYAHTFLAAGSTKGERRACPYESVFTSAEGLLMQEARDDVYRMMLAEHLEPNATLHVPEDHLSFECDFMADLCARALLALGEGDEREARRLLDVQRAFAHDHLLAWVDDFSAAVDACCRTDFYRGLALMTRGYVRLDASLLDTLAAETASAAVPHGGNRGE